MLYVRITVGNNFADHDGTYYAAFEDGTTEDEIAKYSNNVAMSFAELQNSFDKGTVYTAFKYEIIPESEYFEGDGEEI